MTVMAASIEANGWVLAVDGVWGPSSFASFALDPEGTAAVSLAVTAAGFDRAGGQAVANAARGRGPIVATLPLRRPYPDQALLDEQDLGGGVRRVRLALSRHVHSGETVSASFAAGWRAGLGATGLAVTNGSTKAAPLPSFRWAVPPYQRQTGPFRVDLLVAHILAEGREAVAGVKFVCTDGATTHEVWADAASTSPLYGDGLRCWGATLNPSGLAAGLITVHAEVYPWVGAMRRTGNARSTDNFAAFSVEALSPLHVAWDPAGTRYPEAHVYIDPAGTTTASAGMVQASLAAAKAVAPASRAADWNTALQAIYLANRTAPAANGRAAITRMADNAVLTLAPGAHSWTAASPTSGLTSAECRVILQGDPDAADPRSECIIRTGTSHSCRADRWLFRRLTTELGGTSFPVNLLYCHWDDCTVRGKAGQETASTGVHLTMPAGRWGFSATRTRWWRFGNGMSGTNQRFGLVRGCEVSRACEAPAVIGTAYVADATVTTNQTGFRSGWGTISAGSEGVNRDSFLWGCVATPVAARGVAFGYVGAGTLADHAKATRNNHVNNLVERSTFSSSGVQDTQPFHSVGEQAWSEAVDCLVEGCTYVGERFNFGYSDPPGAPAAGDTNRNTGNAIRNSFFDWLPTKHDVFQLDGTQIGSWSVLYGVEQEGNALGARHPSAGPNFAYAFEGLRTVRNPLPGVEGSWPGFSNDRSRYSGGTASGGGSYRPMAGSPLLGRGRRAVIDADGSGAARAAVFAAGAVEGDAPAAVVQPGSAWHATADQGMRLDWLGRVRGEAALLAHRAAGGVLGWRGVLAPAPGEHGHGATGARVAGGGEREVPEVRTWVVAPEPRSIVATTQD